MLLDLWATDSSTVLLMLGTAGLVLLSAVANATAMLAQHRHTKRLLANTNKPDNHEQ